MNDLMSLGLHRTWKREFINLINLNSNDLVLDLASGSGDLTKIIKEKSNCKCVVYDSSIEMIDEAKKKLDSENLFFLCGQAENLPFKNEIFDYVVVGFGLRNFSDVEKSIREIYRVLKKGGGFFCLEFSEINNIFLRKAFNLYSKIIPIYGGVFLNNKVAYSYLVQSIKHFPNQIELTKKLQKSGFANIEAIDILNGLASIHMSKKK